MPTFNSIPIDKLVRLLGTSTGPSIIDVRTAKDFAADPRLLPGAVRRSHTEVALWAHELAGRSAVVVCHTGSKLSHGVAAWLRHHGAAAESLEGGASAWAAAGLAMVPEA